MPAITSSPATDQVIDWKALSGNGHSILPTDNCACAECRFMKMNTLEKLRDCLRDLKPELMLPEDIRARAERPILRMLELSK